MMDTNNESSDHRNPVLIYSAIKMLIEIGGKDSPDHMEAEEDLSFGSSIY